MSLPSGNRKQMCIFSLFQINPTTAMSVALYFEYLFSKHLISPALFVPPSSLHFSPSLPPFLFVYRVYSLTTHHHSPIRRTQ